MKSAAATAQVLLMLMLFCGTGKEKIYAYEDTYGESSYSETVASTEKEIDGIFPSSYAAPLKVLLNDHPNWRFRAFYTGMKWEECFDGSFTKYGYDYYDGAVTGVSELLPERNLVEYIDDKGSDWYRPTSWYSTKIGSAFDWEKNCWNVLSDPDFVQASEELIRYSMDVRNFLTEEQIFQFEDQTAYKAYLSDVERVLKAVSANKAGIFFWMQAADETGISSDYKRQEAQELTYAQAIYEIGRRLNVNPVVLAARIIQEQGLGDSPMISGKKTFTVTWGKDKGKTVRGGYYNYFNIEATDGGENEGDYSAIYNNGLTEAYYEGWNTRYAALYGGAEKLKKNYLSNDQQTVYMQKFNVNASSPGCMITQYMQAVETPRYEAQKAYRSYSEGKALDREHLFIIPVFTEMPAEIAARPVKDGNPNDKLGSIALNGSEIEDFSADRSDYLTANMKVGSSKVLLSVHAYAPTSKITVGTQSAKGDFDEYVSLNNGKNTLKIVCRSEYGTKRKYTVRIFRGLSAPAEVTVKPSENGWKVSFPASEAAEEYTVQKRTGKGNYETIAKTLKTDKAGNLYFYDSDPAAGTEYTYRVRAGAADFSGTKRYSTYRTSEAVTWVPYVKVLKADRYKSGFRITFGEVENADGYEVERKSGNGSYENLSVSLKKGKGRYSFTNPSLKTGVKYRYRIRAYVKAADGTKKYGPYTETAVLTGVRKVTGLKAENTASGIRLSWKKLAGADGYLVERKTGNGEFKLVKKIKSGDTLKYTNVNRTEGAVYQYRVRAYVGTSETAGLPCTAVKKCFVSQPEIVSVKKLKSGTVRIRVKADTKVTGYQIQYAYNTKFTEKETVYVKKKDLKTSVISFVPKKKGTCYIRVRAVIRKDGVKYYSVPAKTRKIVLK